jgi:hypothetical protein
VLPTLASSRLWRSCPEFQAAIRDRPARTSSQRTTSGTGHLRSPRSLMVKGCGKVGSVLANRRRVVPGKPVIALAYPVLAASGSCGTPSGMIGAPIVLASV